MSSSLSVRCGLVTTLALLAGVTAESSCLDVDASFEPAAKDEKQFNMAAFNGKTIAFQKYGVFRFALGGAMQTLTTYQRMDLPEQERNWVLIPFQDRTNGKETYGGDRYLDLYFPIGAHTENRLKIAVTAGEKAYASKH